MMNSLYALHDKLAQVAGNTLKVKEIKIKVCYGNSYKDIYAQ